MNLTFAFLALAALALPAAAQMVTPNTPRTTYGSSSRWGTNPRKMNINLLSTRRFERWDPVPIVTPRPCPTPRPIPAPPATGVSARYNSGSGLTVDAAYRDDRWSLGLHLGAAPRPPATHDTPACGEAPVVVLPAWGHSGVLWTSPYTTLNPTTTTLYRGDGPLDARLFSQAPPAPAPTTAQAATPVEPPAPASPLDAGLLALREGDHALAVAALRRHLRVLADDAHAMRALAVALIETKAFDDAGSVMRQAYRTDARLAAEPLFPRSLGYADKAYRALLTRAVAHAHRANTASAWLLVAVLMQGEGRAATAAPMLDKAAKLGLEAGIADALAAELRR